MCTRLPSAPLGVVSRTIRVVFLLASIRCVAIHCDLIPIPAHILRTLDTCTASLFFVYRDGQRRAPALALQMANVCFFLLLCLETKHSPIGYKRRNTVEYRRHKCVPLASTTNFRHPSERRSQRVCVCVCLALGSDMNKKLRLFVQTLASKEDAVGAAKHTYCIM